MGTFNSPLEAPRFVLGGEANQCPHRLHETGDQPANRVSLVTMKDLSLRLVPPMVDGVNLSCEATQGRTKTPPPLFLPPQKRANKRARGGEQLETV